MLKTTVPPFTLMVANVVPSDFIDDSEGQAVGDGLSGYGGGSDSDMAVVLILICR